IVGELALGSSVIVPFNSIVESCRCGGEVSTFAVSDIGDGMCTVEWPRDPPIWPPFHVMPLLSVRSTAENCPLRNSKVSVMHVVAASEQLVPVLVPEKTSVPPSTRMLPAIPMGLGLLNVNVPPVKSMVR